LGPPADFIGLRGLGCLPSQRPEKAAEQAGSLRRTLRDCAVANVGSEQ
jgi:hypothetical protein